MTGVAGTVAITALGMVSSLGRDLVTSCAAARGGLSLGAELKVMDFRTEGLFGAETLDGPPSIIGHTVRGVADGFAGPAKALVLAAAALRDLLTRSGLSPYELQSTGLVVNLSDRAIQDADTCARSDGTAPALPSTSWRASTASFAQRLAAMAGLPIPGHLQVVHHGGHAGLALAIRDALTLVQGGRASRCLVGAVDSRVEPGFLAAAARLKLLRTNENPVGLIPGEGAAFFMVERDSQRRVGDPPTALLRGVTFGSDPAGILSDAPPSGSVLAEVLRGALQADGASASGWLIGDLNGTERRAAEWGRAIVRARSELDVAGMPLWLPASSFGDTGAASAAMAVCMAARAFERGYAPANRCVIWMSSEGGAKGAIALRGVAG